MDSATQNLVLRWGGIGYDLAGASASVNIFRICSKEAGRPERLPTASMQAWVRAGAR